MGFTDPKGEKRGWEIKKQMHQITVVYTVRADQTKRFCTHTFKSTKQNYSFSDVNNFTY